jgi:hypothetical protein
MDQTKPIHPHTIDQVHRHTLGITLREWLIGQALAGIGEGTPSTVARMAIERADAVIKALAEED